jgi:2-methylcitrate dehydratase PrpD
MAEWVCADGPLPPDTRRLLAIHLLDTVGAWIAGTATEEHAMLAHLFGDEPLDRAALGVATTRLTEIDDIHMASCTTPGSVVVPCALAMAARRPPDAHSFARALRAGYEVITRFGIAVAGPDIVYRGFWPTLLAAPLGAAAVTARLLDLDTGRTADALAMALTLTSGSAGGHRGRPARWLLLGLTARNGCAAALAAAEGFECDRTLLDGDWMARTHGVPCDSAPLVAAAHNAAGELSLKPYCAAKQCIAAIDAFRELLGQGIAPDEISRVRVAVPPAYAAMIGHRNAAQGRLGRITSAAYHLALAAYFHDALYDVARPDHASDPRIAAFMDRVETAADESLAQHYPRRWPARVEAMLKDGRTASKLVVDTTGDPGYVSDFSPEEKFHRLADAGAIAETCLAATEHDSALAALSRYHPP